MVTPAVTLFVDLPVFRSQNRVFDGEGANDSTSVHQNQNAGREPPVL